MRIVIVLWLLSVASILVPGQAMAQNQAGEHSHSAGQILNPRVLMSTTKGDFVLELDKERAPRTVENFLKYVDDGFYAETVFHRVIEGFMIQGGGFSTQFQRKTTRPPVSNEAYNGLRNLRYTIAMARTNDPHSATSQFFINSADNRNLDHKDTTRRGWGYAVFGKVVEGKQVIEEISQVRTSSGGSFARDVPVKPVVIISVIRLEDVSAATPVKALPSSSTRNRVRDNEPSDPRSKIEPADVEAQPVEQN
ncbi:MAG: peptidylprolyl isomerase [Granulosicoccus sp.]